MESIQPYFRCIGHFANIIWNKQFSYFRISWVVSVLYTWFQCGISWSVSVVESAAGVVASAKTGAEMIEDSSKLFLFPPDHPPGTLRAYIQTLLHVTIMTKFCLSSCQSWNQISSHPFGIEQQLSTALKLSVESSVSSKNGKKYPQPSVRRHPKLST